ncbi:MAG: extracellular solute-binding protein [Treponema sp.]|jgi:multiple sugar transport system substrate-binding protein|nr:extracellular solute-binding protein [Treponema sp.]
MNIIRELLNRLKNLPGISRRNSANRSFVDKFLWLLVLVLITGFFLLRFTIRGGLGGDVTLVFAQWWEDQLDSPVLEELAGEFGKQNPEITVQIEKKSRSEIQELLETAEHSPRQELPDILSVDPYWGPSLLGALGQGEDASSMVQIISFISPLFYNIDLLQEAGFDRPPKNQTEFLSYVQRINQTGTGMYGTGLALNSQDLQEVNRQLLSWIWAADNPETAEDFSFNSRQSRSVLNFLKQLGQNLYGNPFTMTGEELLAAFAEGKIGMMIGSIDGIRTLRTAMKGNFGITTIPGTESYARKPVFTLAGWYAGISKDTKHREEALQFITFLKERAVSIAAAAYAIPGSGRRNPDQAKNDPHYAKAFDMYEAGEMIREISDLWNSSDYAALNLLIHTETELLFTDQTTPEQSAESLQQGWERITGQRVQTAP